MPYSDNSAFDTLWNGPATPGPSPTVSLMPYNRLTVVVSTQGTIAGLLAFEGSIDGGGHWYRVALLPTMGGAALHEVDLAAVGGTRAYSLNLPDSTTSHFRVSVGAGATGNRLTVIARKENS